MMSQARKDPAFNDLNADLCLGFVLGFIGSGWNNRDAIVSCQLLVSGVDIGIIPASLGHPQGERMSV